MSEQAKHTPGPWAVGDSKRNNHRTISNGQYIICEIWMMGDERKKNKQRGKNIENANARLIALAPELLKVCKNAAIDLTAITEDSNIKYAHLVASGIAAEMRGVTEKMKVESNTAISRAAANASELMDLKRELQAVQGTCTDLTEITAERDRLAASNAELLAALEKAAKNIAALAEELWANDWENSALACRSDAEEFRAAIAKARTDAPERTEP